MEKFVYIDKKGAIVLFTDFFYAGPFREGLAVVYDDNKNKRGYIDKSGKEVIPLKYNLASDFSEGLACVATQVER
jgi:WG containing repeat